MSPGHVVRWTPFRTSKQWRTYFLACSVVVLTHYLIFVTYSGRQGAQVEGHDEDYVRDENIREADVVDKWEADDGTRVTSGYSPEFVNSPSPLADLNAPDAWFPTAMAGADTNPAAISSLVAYASYHAEQMRLLAETPADEDTDARVLVLADTPSAGLGNRVAALVSAAALAVLTRRAIVVNWPGTPLMDHPDGDEQISFPPFERLFDAPEIGVDNVTSAVIVNMDFAKFVRERPRLRRQLSDVGAIDLDTDEGARALLCGGGGGGDDAAAGIARDLSPDGGPAVLAISSWDYFLPALVAGGLWKKSADAMAFERNLGGGDSLAAALARFLLRPRRELRQRAADFAREQLGIPPDRAGATPLRARRDANDAGDVVSVVGIHFRRRGYLKMTFEQMKESLSCASELAASNSGTRWLLATDTEDAYHLAWNEARSRGLSAARYARAGTASAGAFRTWDGVEVALIELWLLATVADAVVATPGSTFTRIASWLSGRPSRVVGLPGDDRASCGLETLRQGAPCYHGWRNFILGAESSSGASPGRARAKELDLGDMVDRMSARVDSEVVVASDRSFVCLDYDDVVRLHRGHEKCSST